jgi:hypothetical protein
VVAVAEALQVLHLPHGTAVPNPGLVVNVLGQVSTDGTERL